ncbi:MAG TPA: cation diffusion facilitator family transporter [Tepidisphaeraceae bacterium]|jgi:cation diffusion facilitator family transporter
MLAFWHRIPRAEKVAIGLSIGLGVSLLVVKFAAYALTQSAAIFSDAVESIVNVMASLVALWALSLAHTPADEKHPYGHGKVEFISAAFEGGMIVLAALFILVRTLDLVFFHPSEPQELDRGLGLMLLAMVLNGSAGVALVRVGRREHSITLEADGQHLVADAVTSVAVIVSLLIVRFTGWAWADPLMAIVIAGYIAVAGIRMAQRSFGGLMDQQDVADERQLTGILDAHARPDGVAPRVCGYHKLRHRHSGRYHWVDFHLVVPSHLSVADGHRIASTIEYEIEQTLGLGNATAHIEPCEAKACGACRS